MLKKLMTGIALAAVMGTAPIFAVATPVISFNEATGISGANQNQSVGWQFDVLAPLTVIGLGWFDEGANGLGVAHMVGIWAPDGSLLTFTTVAAGTTDPLDGQYRTNAITPIVLSVGTGYIIGGENFINSGDRLAANVVMNVNPSISFFDATFSNLNSGFVRPTQFSVATDGFFGPMFSIRATVPEPATLLLVGLGATMLALRRRRT